MQTFCTTQRLQLIRLDQGDAPFILELLNTEAWKRFIGDRNVTSINDASSYIQKIEATSSVSYWTVKLKDTSASIGVITFIKRDYLNYHDIGFAFLPQYSKLGYAYEATMGALAALSTTYTSPEIVATTLAENTNSIQLLQKLGFSYKNEITHENDKLRLFSISTECCKLDKLCFDFYSLFTCSATLQHRVNELYQLCLPNASFENTTLNRNEMLTLTEFIDSRHTILSNGSYTSFEEYELSRTISLDSSSAIRFSSYEKRGIRNGSVFFDKGVKQFHYKKTSYGWKIEKVSWCDEVLKS
ncbi:MAG TPA: GNAT family N-acetyltransferase [Bacteroidia bacterium]|nr:GNAT family N-acetyltransferase [Bacteroidia bacterium]